MSETFILADNQDVTYAGMKSYVTASLPGARVGRVACKRDLIDLLERYPSAVVIVDYTLFDFKSIDDMRILSSRFPEVHWVLFSAELSDDFIRKAHLERNVSILLKDNTEEEICLALRCAARGERYLCHQISNFLLTAPSQGAPDRKLTVTEVEILKLIAAGLSAKDIAARRFLSTHTVITHKKNIFRKLGVNTVFEATKYALRAGLVELAEYYI